MSNHIHAFLLAVMPKRKRNKQIKADIKWRKPTLLNDEVEELPDSEEQYQFDDSKIPQIPTVRQPTNQEIEEEKTRVNSFDIAYHVQQQVQQRECEERKQEQATVLKEVATEKISELMHEWRADA